MKREWTKYSDAADHKGFTQYEALVVLPADVQFLEPHEPEDLANCSVFVRLDKQLVVINPLRGDIFSAMSTCAAKKFPKSQIIDIS